MWTGLGLKTLLRLELDHVKGDRTLCRFLYRRTKQAFSVFIGLVSFYAFFELRVEVAVSE